MLANVLSMYLHLLPGIIYYPPDPTQVYVALDIPPVLFFAEEGVEDSRYCGQGNICRCRDAPGKALKS